MFQQWMKNLQFGAETQAEPDQYWLERLTALLLVEIARADSEIGESEVDTISQALKLSSASISESEVEEIVTTARQDAESSISFRDHVREINKGFNRAQKLMLIEQMWRVAYADGDLDKYEEYTIRKLADLLFVDHQDFIKAKLRVIES